MKPPFPKAVIVTRKWDERVHKTQFPELGYQQVLPSFWRFVELDGGGHVGRDYPSKETLLAALPEYARLYGCA